MERIISMIFRQLLNRGINAGIRKGADMMAGDDDTPEGKAARQRNRKGANQARKALRMTRRMGRF